MIQKCWRGYQGRLKFKAARDNDDRRLRVVSSIKKQSTALLKLETVQRPVVTSKAYQMSQACHQEAWNDS